jgi:putative ABC transport system permease protein
MPRWTLFRRLILRPLRREPTRTLLTVMAVALGVAAVVAIELAGSAAAGSFHSSVETLTGRAEFELTATGGVPDEAVARLAAIPLDLKIHPRIEDYAMLADSRRLIPLVGVDMIADTSFDSNAVPDSSGLSTFQRDDSIWITAGLGYKTGDQVTLLINDLSHDFVVRGVLPGGAGDFALLDLAPAERLLKRSSVVDRVLIDPPANSREDLAAMLNAALPPGLVVTRAGARTEENQKMLAAFRWNLRVLSYISLTVGAFLIFNTISVSVVRRRYEIGILRALGATRGTILAAFLGEATAFGLLGSIAGLALGRVMAEGAVRLVSATVESLYVTSSPGAIALSWPVAILALVAGVGISILSALAPAREASFVAPVEAMARGSREHQARVHKWRDLAMAVTLAVAAWIASRQPPMGGKPLFGYIAALLLVAASALAIPVLVAALNSASSGLWRHVGAEALIASRSLVGSLRRTSVLVGALSTAIAMLAAVGIMVGSFRQTVVLWLEDRLQADLYLQPAIPTGADRHPTLAPDLVPLLAALPGVAAVDQLRSYEISYQGLPAMLGGADTRVVQRYGTRTFLSGANPASVFTQLQHGDAVIVSEPFANKHGVHNGDSLTLNLGEREPTFRVAGVYYDYGNERGTVLMDRATMLKYLPDPAPTNIALYLQPGVSPDEVLPQVERVAAGRRVLVLTNRAIREQGMRVFDRTFAITYALEAVAVFVAVMGVAGALLALVIDRRREIGLLRFLGAAQDQIRRMVLIEAGLLGLVANAVGLILGFVLSLLLIFVINKQSFGWTIQFHWPVAVLLGALSLVYGATILAALYPARVATRLVPIEVVHEE